MSTLTSLLDAKATRLAEQVDELGRETAESLHAAASSIRKGSKAIGNLAEGTATKLDGAGSYVARHDVKRAIGESRRLIGRHPVELLVLAASVGFAAGFAVRRLTHICDKSSAPAPSD